MQGHNSLTRNDLDHISDRSDLPDYGHRLHGLDQGAMKRLLAAALLTLACVAPVRADDAPRVTMSADDAFT